MPPKLRPPTDPALIAALHAEATQTNATPAALQAQLTGTARHGAGSYWTTPAPLDDPPTPTKRQLLLDL